MNFLEVKKILIEDYRLEKIINLTQEIGGVYEWTVDAIFFLDRAINGQKDKIENIEEGEDLVHSILEKIMDVLLMDKIYPVEKETIVAFIELIDNWLRLVESKRDYLFKKIKQIILLLDIHRTLEEQVEVLGLLYKKIYMIYLAEPIETKISELYREKIQDYFSTTNHGEYNV